MRKHFWSYLILFSLAPLAGHAKVFRNAYVAFELPDKWNCTLEVTEWVCRSEDSQSSKEAIIILTAKEVGPTDSFPIYEQTLNTERTVPSRAGVPVKSTVVYKAKQVQINDQKWVDGLQLGSEIPNYYTRYVATLKDNIAILVTFSAHRTFYTKYSKDFFRAIMSLRVIASKGLLTKPDTNFKGGGGEAYGAGGAGNSQGFDPSMGAGGRKKKAKKNNMLMIGAGLLAAALGVYLVLNKKK